LIQHVENVSLHQTSPRDKSQPAHTVDIVPGTLLAGIAGTEHKTWQVNSRHHQALDRIGPGLRVAAQSPDGVIEALERPG
jgi:putative glutamine amidotransferase